MEQFTVVIPAYNEGPAVASVVTSLQDLFASGNMDAEILVVVDGATDDTAANAAAAGARVVEHPTNQGYGQSLKTGITLAKHGLIVITDADLTYEIEKIPEMVRLAKRYDMVVGARQGNRYWGGLAKRMGRFVFRHLAEFAAGQSIPDINSGLRVFRRSQMVPFFPVISAGFSFTTTCTLTYMLNDLSVHYLPTEYHQRSGKSKVNYLRDSRRALQIIVEAILRMNPVKMFILLALPFGVLAFLLAIIAIALQSSLWGVASVLAICTAGVILGIGFLAVSTLPPRKYYPARYLPVSPPEDSDS